MERHTRKQTSAVWNYFIKKGEYIATCKACQNDFSYKGSVSNLSKHWKKKHSHVEMMRSRIIDTSDSEQEVSLDKSCPTWKFFEIQDSDKFVATCKLCEQEIPYDSVAELTQHIKEQHDVAAKDSDDEGSRSSKTSKATAWQYFKCVDSRLKIASCLICNKELSFNSTVSNLMKHLKRKHPDYKLLIRDEDDDSKTVVMSSDGQLYAIESIKQGNEETDDERDPIEMDTVYLEDLENPPNEIKPQKRIIIPKPNLKPSSVKRIKLNKEQISNIRSRNIRFSSNRYSLSSDEDVRKKPKEDTSTIDYFGKYIVSLLKDLPKQVSEQLQGEIIKQIMSTKVALQATAEFTANNELKENSVKNQVTVTISNTDTNVVNEDGNKNKVD